MTSKQPPDINVFCHPNTSTCILLTEVQYFGMVVFSFSPGLRIEPRALCMPVLYHQASYWLVLFSIPSSSASFSFFLKTSCVAQAGLEFLGSMDPPASDSQVARTTNVQPLHLASSLFESKYITMKCTVVINCVTSM